MSGKFTCLQARIKEDCEFASDVPCAARYFYRVGIHATGDNKNFSLVVRNEAIGLSRKMGQLEFLILAEMWNTNIRNDI